MESSGVVLAWPEAAALVGAIIAITTGAIKLHSMNKSTYTAADMHEDHQRLAARVNELERQVSNMETNLENTIGGQIADLKGDMRRMSDKMDTLVREVVTALGTLSGK